MLKRILTVLLALALCVGIASAEQAEQNSILGKPFPDFTVTDSEGNTFTLSEALKDHEAVLINFWATWCEPCKDEFPIINKLYADYKDKVAFIALSKDNKKDTLEKIEAFRKEKGLDFPMGRDEDQKLLKYVDSSSESIPKTVIVDRFGNAVFYHRETFKGVGELKAVLDAVLGDGYKETTVLTEIPEDTSTRAMPVSAATVIYPEDSSCKKVIFHVDAYPLPLAGYIVPDSSVRLRLEIGAESNISKTYYADEVKQATLAVEDFYDPEQGVFVYDQAMPDPANSEIPHHYLEAYTADRTPGADPTKNAHIYLIPGEEYIEEVITDLNKIGDNFNARWEYADEAAEQAAEGKQAYIIHVVDQYNNPVEEVTVNFCTDTACTPQETDETGTITYEGEPYKYHVQIIDVPEGYSYDESFDMYTTTEYGEWVIRVKKD